MKSHLPHASNHCCNTRTKDCELTLKVALVGCGKTAEMHVSGIQRAATMAQLVAVCDIEPLMAEQLALRHHIPNHYIDFDELLTRERPDVVHIVTPPQSHLPLAIKALSFGAHLVLEKPLGMDLSETRRIISAAEDRSRKLTVAYTYYFDPAARMLRQLVREGVMGEATHLESFFGYDLRGPYGTPVLADPYHWVHSLPGKLFQNVLDHLVNKITEFMPDEKPLIQAHFWKTSNSASNFVDHGTDFADEVRVVIAGERQSAYLTFSSNSRPVRHLLLFHGTKNTAELDFECSTITLWRQPVLPGVLGRLATPFREGWQYIGEGGRNVMRFMQSDYQYFSAFHYLLTSFYESIISGLPIPIPYSEIMRNASYMDQILQQMNCEKAFAK